MYPQVTALCMCEKVSPPPFSRFKERTIKNNLLGLRFTLGTVKSLLRVSVIDPEFVDTASSANMVVRLANNHIVNRSMIVQINRSRAFRRAVL